MPILLPLSEVHDLHNALYGSEYAQRLTPEDAADILVETKRVAPGYTWQVVRLAGKYYLRAWTLKAIPLGEARDQMVPLFCQPFRPGTRYDGSRVQISIPLDAIGSYESTSDGVEETAKAQVTNLDARAWEAWKAPTIPPPLAGSSSSVGR
jgi:hypothetical protein